MIIKKIISGGQTGVDRAALDTALEMGISHGGFCPYGRKAEDGIISFDYNLIQLDSIKYSERTRKNIEMSRGTLILCNGIITNGTALTQRICDKMSKPLIIINLFKDLNLIRLNFIQWIELNSIDVLNIAGPRESESNVYNQSKRILFYLLQ